MLFAYLSSRKLIMYLQFILLYIFSHIKSFLWKKKCMWKYKVLYYNCKLAIQIERSNSHKQQSEHVILKTFGKKVKVFHKKKHKISEGNEIKPV